MAVGSLDKQGDLIYKACLGQFILSFLRGVGKDFREALSGLSHIYCAGILITTSLSQGYILGGDLGARKASRTHIARTGEQGRGC